MRNLFIALFLIPGCRDDGSGAPTADTDAEDDDGTAGSGDDDDSTPTGSGPSTSASTNNPTEGEETGDSGPSGCEDPDDLAFVDGLNHLGRGIGDTFIEILDLATRDRLVYSCTATQGITIWNAEIDGSPSNLVENVGPAGLAHSQFPRCQHIAMDNDSLRAVITNRGDEVQPTPWLYLYDLSNPTNPVPLRGWSGPESIEGVVLNGDRIYAAAHKDGVLIFEDQGGASLTQVGGFSDGSSDAWQPLLIGDTLLVAEGTTGLRVYDVAGNDPILLDTVALPGSSKDLIRDGDTLWVAAAEAIVGLDATDPTAPMVIAEREIQGTAIGVAMGADGVLFTAEWDEIRGYDTTSAELPLVWSESVPTDDDFSRVLTIETDAADGRLYAGEWTGMHAFAQNSDPHAPDVFATPGSIQFGQVAAGDSFVRAFVVRNTGTQTLRVSSIDPPSAEMTVDISSFDVCPGEAVAVEATFQPSDDGPEDGFFYLNTNDPDEELYRIRASGNIPGLDLGDPGPDFALTDLDGNTWTKADLAGNVAVLAYFATF